MKECCCKIDIIIQHHTRDRFSEPAEWIIMIMVVVVVIRLDTDHTHPGVSAPAHWCQCCGHYI